MKLTLSQAVATSGKTRRQLVYLIEQGRIPAEKVGGRWYLDSTDLDLDPAAQQRAARQQAGLRSAIEDALLPKEQRRRYSFRDLKAYQIAQPLLTNGNASAFTRRVKPVSADLFSTSLFFFVLLRGLRGELLFLGLTLWHAFAPGFGAWLFICADK